MANYHLTMKTVSRSRGQSIVASTSYITGEKLFDERANKTWDYSSKDNVVFSEILIPKDAPKWAHGVYKSQYTNKQEALKFLTNVMEKCEHRRDAQVGRSIEFSLPIELNLEQSRVLAKEFVEEQLCGRGMVAVYAIHWADGNPHYHVNLSTRALTEEGFGVKNREWNKKEFCQTIREKYAEYVNFHLEKNGINERVDHRSYKDQGLDIEATKHLGNAGVRLGEASRIFQENQEIEQNNINKILDNPDLVIKEVSLKQATFTREDLLRNALKRLGNDERLVNIVSEKLFKSEMLVNVGEDIKGNIRFSTKDYVAAEGSLFSAAEEMNKRNNLKLDTNKINELIETKYAQFSDEQKAAVLHCTTDNDIVCIQGCAGTGKTTMLEPVCEAYIREGYKVIGMARDGMATSGLADRLHV